MMHEKLILGDTATTTNQMDGRIRIILDTNFTGRANN